jgi:hypothetical protein
MTSRRTFNRSELEETLSKIGGIIKPSRVCLIGGCAMAFRGQKLATKDIDAVFTSHRELQNFIQTLKNLGFFPLESISTEYMRLSTSTIMRNPEGMQFDLFCGRVCGGLEISKGMMKRAELFKKFENLQVYLLSPEDIFLFKGMTERETDIDDMSTLAAGGLNWDAIKEECLSQKKRKIWESFLADRLVELKERYGVDAPILKDLWKSADLELLKLVFTKIINEGNDTVDRVANIIRKKYRYSESWTRRMLRKLVEKEILDVERQGRVYKYRVR